MPIDVEHLKGLHDLKQSGALTSAEFQKAKDQAIEVKAPPTDFELADTNGDGVVTPEELAEYMAKKAQASKLAETVQGVPVSSSPYADAPPLGLPVAPNAPAMEREMPKGADMLITVNKPCGAKLGIDIIMIASNATVKSCLPGSISEASGLQEGDVIQTINGQAVTDQHDATAKLSAASGEIEVAIYRGSPSGTATGSPSGGSDNECMSWETGKCVGRVIGCVLCTALSVLVNVAISL